MGLAVQMPILYIEDDNVCQYIVESVRVQARWSLALYMILVRHLVI